MLLYKVELILCCTQQNRCNSGLFLIRRDEPLHAIACLMHCHFERRADWLRPSKSLRNPTHFEGIVAELFFDEAVTAVRIAKYSHAAFPIRIVDDALVAHEGYVMPFSGRGGARATPDRK